MDNRGYGSSGYSSWGGGSSSSSRGSGGYDLYGYKDSMSSGGGYGGGYGGGGGSGQMKRGLSAGGMVSTGTSADAVIAKINQRLDMLTQLEGAGGMKGGRSDRFDQYESYDSRPSSVNPRDLYRSASYGYGDGPSDLLAQRGGGYGGGAYDASSSFGPAKARQPRDSYSSPGWGGRRSPRRGRAPGVPGGRGFGRRQEPPMGGGGGGGGMGGARGGHSPGGRGRLPSLLSHRMYPETGAYQPPPPPGPQDLPSGRPFGMGPGIRAGRQRGRKRPVNRINPQREVQKKRKQTVTPGDEPESKMGKTETDNTESTNDSTQPGGETSEGTTSAAAKITAEDDALTMQEEINQMKQKLQAKPPVPQDRFPKLRKRRGFQERVMFACSVCKFRSFYSDEMATHMESRFHKDHFRFLSNQLSKPTIDFLQEYLNNKFKKTEERTKQIENISAAICQVYKEQDLTRDIGMEHFMKKVEAAHCAACDLFIPMQHHLIQRHLKSPDHNFNRKGMMEQSKHASLSVARSILNHKVIARKLESYLKGENPFDGSDKDPEDSLMDVSGAELEDKSQALAEDGEGARQDSNHAPVGEGQNDGVEAKMEEEELEGILGEDCLEGEEEGNEGEAGLKEEGAELKDEEEKAALQEEGETKTEEVAVLNEDEEGLESALGEDEEGEEGIEGDLGDGEEQGVEGDLGEEEEEGVAGDFGDEEEGIEGHLGEDDEGVEAEEEEGIEVVEDEEGGQGELDDEEDDVAEVEDDDGVVLVE